MAIEKHMLQTHSLFEKAGEVFEGVVKLKERIAELETERDSFEKSFNEMTEAYRKSQRSLWLARAERAKECHFMWCQFIYDKKYGIVKFNVRKEWGQNIKQGQTLHTPQGWADVWDDIEYKCHKKEDEYK